MSAHVTLLLGGARSGKSQRAEALGQAFAGPVTYVATAERSDDVEWSARIDLHRARRPAEWRTLEAPLELPRCLREEARGTGSLVIVDCLSVWLSNCLLAEREIAAEVDALEAALGSARDDCVLVSNEVGLGVVPPSALGRRFRDEHGRLNQRVAARADRVELWVAGLCLVLKPT